MLPIPDDSLEHSVDPKAPLRTTATKRPSPTHSQTKKMPVAAVATRSCTEHTILYNAMELTCGTLGVLPAGHQVEAFGWGTAIPTELQVECLVQQEYRSAQTTSGPADTHSYNATAEAGKGERQCCLGQHIWTHAKDIGRANVSPMSSASGGRGRTHDYDPERLNIILTIAACMDSVAMCS